jgi:hypothetical protein
MLSITRIGWLLAFNLMFVCPAVS